MAKKQSRRSVSLSRTTYERLKAYCETNELSMSEFVETRIGDYLGRGAKKKGDDSAKKTAERIFTF
jgi:hypothetical protein